MKTINSQLAQIKLRITFVSMNLALIFMVLLIMINTGASAQTESVNDFHIAKNGENVMIHTILKNKTAPYTVYLEKLNSSGSYISISQKTGILSDWDVNYYFTDKLNNTENNIYRIKLVEEGQVTAYSAIKTIELIDTSHNLADNIQ